MACLQACPFGSSPLTIILVKHYGTCAIGGVAEAAGIKCLIFPEATFSSNKL